MNSKGVDAAAGVSTLGNTESGASTLASASVYEVFLNFRGKDTRKGFTNFLYTYLVDANIQTFRDNDEIQVGQEIGPALLKAIKESKISIPIFSQNYASSKWCLWELQQIVECYKNGTQKIYPIFYDVDPSDVRNQNGSYELEFSSHEKKFDEGTVQGWRHALNLVGGMKGWELKKETDGREGEFVKLVVEKVLTELKNYTHVPQNMVGMDKHIEELMGRLEVDSNDVWIVGIHGMGGLGKTTICKVIYNEMCKNYDGQCFLDNVSEKSKHYDGIAEMQKQFICSIQKRGVSSVSDGRSSIKDVVHENKLLLVLDDIDEYFQVEMLMGESSWYGAQSRIILTTRDKGVLDETKLKSDYSSIIYRSYSPKPMDNSDSLHLFSKHAFKRDFPMEEYNILSMEVVSIAAGLPLVLVVLGSTLFALTKDKGLWEDKLKQLRKIPHKKVLKFSFEAPESDAQWCSKAKKKNRGFTCGVSEKKVKQLGRRPRVHMTPGRKHPREEHPHTFRNEIRAWIRERAPMIATEWGEQPTLETLIADLTSHLESTVPDIVQFVSKAAKDSYTQWKSDIGKFVQKYGPEPVATEFQHQLDECDSLLCHFATPEWQAKSKRMKEARDFDHKLNHTSGHIPFVDRVDEHVASGHLPPYCAISYDQHCKTHLELADKVQADYRHKQEEVVASAPTPTRVEGSDDQTPPPPLVVLDLGTHADIHLTHVRPNKGTHVPRFGTVRVEPKKRGPKPGCTIQSTSIPSEVQELRHEKERLSAEVQELRQEQANFKQRIATLEALVWRILNAPPEKCSQPSDLLYRGAPPHGATA